MTEQDILEFTVHGPITVGRILADSVLDALNVDQFGKAMLGYIESHPGVNLLLDFQQVDYLTSAVLTELLRARTAATEKGGAVRLCTLNDDIREIFQITSLEEVFPINEDVETALTHFERSLKVAEEEAKWGQADGKG